MIDDQVLLSSHEMRSCFDEVKFNIKHRPAKRLFDIIFSLCVLIIGFPLFLVIAIAIKCSSSGDVFYSHERVGRGGRLFKCYKFRTMHCDAEKRLSDLLNKNPKFRAEWESSFKLKNDPRIAPFGNFLRRSSLDELPQFFNVLKGDLSVVGPRPVVHDEVVKHLGEKAAKILSFRPGITCIWQVSGRSDIVYPARVQLDEKYIDNYSLLLDLFLIAKTIPSMIFSKGAY